MEDTVDDEGLFEVGRAMAAADASSGVNISDVIEVIETDEMFVGNAAVGENAGGVEGETRRQQRAFVKIVEQPASKALRFRYECEGRSAGSIPGVNSTPENKTYPSIQIIGHHGRAVVVVSCVTKDAPHRPHPHNLVGKEGCSRGVCTLKMNSDTISFSNLGIQCVKKKDIEDALKVREEIRVDPFRTGFSHKSQPSSTDLNSVRLCFQVFLEGPKKDEFTIPLRPVVSDPIYDKKAMSDLTICKLSDCSASVAGGKEIILLCEKVAKEDIQVRFYEEKDGELVWEGYGDFQPTHVHKQVAISFRTPRYKNIEVDKPVKIWIQLRRPSDGASSESLQFQLVPLDSDPVVLKRKRQKYSGETSPQHVIKQTHDDDTRSSYVGSVSPDTGFHVLQVKREPSETSPNPYMYGAGNISPMYGAGTSPGPPSPHSTPSPVPYNTYYTVNYQPPNQFNLRHGAGGGVVDYHQDKPNTNPFRQTTSAGESLLPTYQPNIIPDGLNNFGTPGAGVLSFLKIGSTNVGTISKTLKLEQDSNRVEAANTDMGDSQTYSLDLNLGNLDSAEITRMAMMTDANLSENLSSNLTLSDRLDKNGKSGMDCDQNNMTDSFTRAANKALQELVSMGNTMYPATQP